MLCRGVGRLASAIFTVQPCVLFRMLRRARPMNRPAKEHTNLTTSLMLAKLFLHTLAITFPPTSSVAKIWSLVDNEVDVLLIILSSVLYPLSVFTLQR